MINKLYNISNQYKEFPIYSLIMFTNQHPHVIKMLEDEHYYKALDELSGSDVALFHTRLFQGRFVMPTPPENVTYFLVPIWEEPSENKKLLPLFSMKDSKSLPCLVTFLFHKGEVFCAKSAINDDSEQTTFNSIKEILKRLAEAAQPTLSHFETMQKAKFEMEKLNFKKGFKAFMKKLDEWRGASGI